MKAQISIWMLKPDNCLMKYKLMQNKQKLELWHLLCCFISLNEWHLPLNLLHASLGLLKRVKTIFTITEMTRQIIAITSAINSQPVPSKKQKKVCHYFLKNKKKKKPWWRKHVMRICTFVLPICSWVPSPNNIVPHVTTAQ